MKTLRTEEWMKSLELISINVGLKCFSWSLISSNVCLGEESQFASEKDDIRLASICSGKSLWYKKAGTELCSLDDRSCKICMLWSSESSTAQPPEVNWYPPWVIKSWGFSRLDCRASSLSSSSWGSHLTNNFWSKPCRLRSGSELPTKTSN